MENEENNNKMCKKSIKLFYRSTPSCNVRDCSAAVQSSTKYNISCLFFFRFKISRYSLQIHPVTQNDTGKYACYAENPYGQEWGNFTVNVLGEFRCSERKISRLISSTSEFRSGEIKTSRLISSRHDFKSSEIKTFRLISYT
jgi:hypothetical protein